MRGKGKFRQFGRIQAMTVATHLRPIGHFLFRFPAFVLCLVMGLDVASAADTIETSLSSGTADGSKLSSLSFDFQDCEEECHFATLTCDENGHVSLELADVPTDDVVKAMQRNEDQIVVKLGTMAFDFEIQKLSFAELTTAWWVEAPLFQKGTVRFPEALATAKTIDFTTAKTPTSVAVDKNVRTWAKGCK
jgi:hypothetical protein